MQEFYGVYKTETFQSGEVGKWYSWVKGYYGAWNIGVVSPAQEATVEGYAYVRLFRRSGKTQAEHGLRGTGPVLKIDRELAQATGWAECYYDSQDCCCKIAAKGGTDDQKSTTVPWGWGTRTLAVAAEASSSGTLQSAGKGKECFDQAVFDAGWRFTWDTDMSFSFNVKGIGTSVSAKYGFKKGSSTDIKINCKEV